MTIQFSVAARNARLNALPAYVGLGPVMHIRSGAAPANCAAANSGTLLATVIIPTDSPSDWLQAAASGSISMSGAWGDTSADASGTAAHFRIFLSDGTTCWMQGTVTATGGGGDMTVDSTTFTAGQSFTITSFTITDGNA